MAEKTEERQWPGQVFDNPQLSYDEAMTAYVKARNDSPPIEKSQTASVTEEDTRRRAVKTEEQALRLKRRHTRQERKHQDAAWRSLRAKRQALDAKQRPRRLKEIRAADETWKAHRAVRRAQVEQRETQDGAWRNARKRIRAEKESLSLITGWIAVLVIIDNCTRQCFGLPLFIGGTHVTAEVVVSALKALLPPELQYLIADRGVHFRGKAMRQLAEAQGFVRVLPAPHRPQSNGIAERFIRTLKLELETHCWTHSSQLSGILERFIDQYNNRPHQGKELNGLSPNEYCRRLQLV